MIPPTLREVRKLMLEAVLQELEHDGDDGCQPPVSEYQGFTPVSHQMGHNEDINLVLEMTFSHEKCLIMYNLDKNLHIVPGV